MSNGPAARRRRLGELLLEAGVLSPAQLQAALAEQQKWGGKLGRVLVEMGHVDELAMVRALSKQLNLPVVDLDHLPLPPSIVHLLRVDLAERYGVFPIGADAKQRTMQLATSDPTNLDSLKELAQATGSRVHTSLATASSIDRAIRRLYYGEESVKPAPAPTRVERSAPENRPVPPAPKTAPAKDPLEELEVSAHRGELTRLVERVAALEKSSRNAELQALSDRVTLLERQSVAQVRALRALVELLIESGLVSRDEYVARANRPT